MRGDKGGDTHFTDEAARGAGYQMRLFTGPDRTFLSDLLEPGWAHSPLKLVGRARTKCVRNWARGTLEWDWEFWGQSREEYKLYHSDLGMGVCRPQGRCLALN